MKKPRWRANALAIATAMLLAVSAQDASALGLGRVTVQSALGEPLRADIDIPEITAEEVASLRAVVASPEAFRAAGFEYNAAMANVQITLQRRPDGRYFLRLSSQRPVNEPFIDLILEANWSSGRIVRDYTMLFDPPNLRQSAPPLAAEVAPATRPAQTPPRAAAPQASRPPAAASAAPTPATREPATASKPEAGAGKQVTVKAGDTAGRIAAANKPTNVSLDQMLVALLRSNPEAFIGGNINRLKAGAVLEVPTAEQAEQVAAGEASRTIIAQSRDFNEFRRRLAEGVPVASVTGSERQASGRVQAQVEEKKPAPASSDKLTLSKGAIQDKGAADKIARERAAKDEATRVAELSKNINELNKLGTATAPASVAAASGAKPGVPLPVGVASAAKAAPSAPAAAPVAAASSVKAVASAQAAAPTVATSASAPLAAPAGASASAAKTASAPAPAVPLASSSAAKAASAAAAVSPPASAPAAVAATAPSASAATSAMPTATAPAASAAASPGLASASAPAAAAASAASAARQVPQPQPVETSLVDDLLENPIVPATVAGVLALLLGFGFYRAQQRKKSTQVDSSFLESRLQPDSFFGASGGQRIDTNEGNATGSSMVYSPSQLDAAGDVDPVAEADVYLAYGRDLQAEEILKEAMRTTPQRVAVHAKLLEIYAKRRDAKAFELIATEAFNLTRGQGPEWEHISELGQALDPANSLYRPGGHPAPLPADGDAQGEDSGTLATQVIPTAVSPSSPPDLDLDLDFSIGDDEPAPAASAPPGVATDMPPVAEPMPALDMDFGSASSATLEPPAPPELPATSPPELAPEQDASDNGLSFDATQTMKPASAKPGPAQAPAPDAGMIEFDLGALSLDLDSPAAASAPPTPAISKPQAEEAIDSTAGAPLSTGGFEVEEGSDPLATKLALAQEFNAIGDPDGARSLAQEVLAEASGDLKQKAQRFLAEIA